MIVFAIGSRVKLRGDVDAMVTAVQIRSATHAAYEVVWWDGGTRHEAWVSQLEVTGTPGDLRETIGFKGQA